MKSRIIVIMLALVGVSGCSSLTPDYAANSAAISGNYQANFNVIDNYYAGPYYVAEYYIANTHNGYCSDGYCYKSYRRPSF